MRVLLISLGSAGDIHPFIAVGRALKARGHEVMLMANDYFQARIQNAGLDFWRVGTSAEYLQIIRDAGLVHGPLSPTFVLDRLILPAIEPTVAALDLLARAGGGGTDQGPFRPDVVFAHHICFGVPEACDRLRLPCVIGVLSPLMWLSRHEPILLPGLPLQDPPVIVDRFLRWLTTPVARLRWDRPIRREMRRIGLATARRDLTARSARGGDSVSSRTRATDARPALALWSPVFRPRLADDPLRGMICGFAIFDRPGSDASANERELLQWMDAENQPPVLVTLGSSVSHHGEAFYQLASRACKAIGQRALLLIGGADMSKHPIEDDGGRIRVIDYAPYGRVMPRTSAVVHHAGVGTTAAALRAGRPTVIIPFANDEFDNADRVRRLGCGVTLKRRKLSVESLGACIRRVLDDRAMQARCAAVAECLQEEDGAATAARELEQLVQR